MNSLPKDPQDCGSPQVDAEKAPVSPDAVEPRSSRRIDGRRLRSLVDPALVPIAASVWLMGGLLALITSTHYQGDDGLNKDIRQVVHDAGTTLPDFTIGLVRAWMVYNGRFFPGSLSWTYVLFWVCDSRVAYKLAIGTVLLGAIVVFGLFVSRLTGHWKTGAIYITIVLGLLQIRTRHDGIISYAGLMPLTAGLSVAAVLIVISRRGFWWATLAALLYSFALVTYETVLLFAPIMVAIIVWKRRSWRPAVAIAIPALAQGLIVAILRLSLHTAPGPAYTVNLESKTVLVTFAKQAIAAFPLSQWAPGAPAMPAITKGAIAIAVLVAGLPTFLSIASLGRSRVRATRTEIVAIAIFGGWIWLSSSAMVSIAVRWQLELHRGQAYLPVVYGYFGLGLCLLAVYLSVDRMMLNRSRPVIVTWRYGSALAIAVVVSLTFAGNVVVASLS